MARVSPARNRACRIVPGYTVVSPFDLYDYPFSHSLLASLIWSAALAGLYYLLPRDRRGALVVGSCVFSHWILDFITHRPDMPLGFGTETRVGLGLWNSLAGTLFVELGMFVAGVVLYARSTEPKDRTGLLGLWGLVAFLLLMYITSIFSPPPPSVTAVAIGAQAGWLLILCAYWIDLHRRPKTPRMEPSP